MQKAFYNDKSFVDAVHIDEDEAILLREHHYKKMETIKPKIEKLRDKADGSTKHDVQINLLDVELRYHRDSFDEALRIIRHYNSKELNKS